MTQSPVTLFVEDIQALAAALPSEKRFPALERVLSRGVRNRLAATKPNHARYELLGASGAGQPAVAALCRVSDSGRPVEEGGYWLRADPVTLRADMSRVFLLSCGNADYTPQEQKELGLLVTQVLEREGIEALQTDSGYWLMALPESPGFDFPALHEVLGRDLAEMLPEHAEAAVWKKRMTDIQVELHQSRLNQRRRDMGQQEINSIWFWGGGVAPGVERKAFSQVVTRDPVTRGLALLAGVPVSSNPDLAAMESPAMIDWLMETADPAKEAEKLEHAMLELLTSPAAAKRGLRLVAGDGRAWNYRLSDRYRIWRKIEPLSRIFAMEPGSG